MKLNPIGFFASIKCENRLTTGQRNVLLAVAAVCIPIFLFMASRAASRFLSHPHLPRGSAQASAASPRAAGGAPPRAAASPPPAAAVQQVEPAVQERPLPADLIPWKVRATLDALLGSSGAVDRLPSIPEMARYPRIGQMEHPIMKGVAERSNTGEKFPYIAIKVRSLRNRAELVEQWEMSPEILPCLGDVSKPIESVIVLYQYIQDKPLMWDELGIADLCRPQFFTGNFTFPEDGGISRSQQKHIPPFRDLVVEGVGADCKGVRWQVIGHPKQASVV